MSDVVSKVDPEIRNISTDKVMEQMRNGLGVSTGGAQSSAVTNNNTRVQVCRM
jgi:hypothetical protein